MRQPLTRRTLAMPLFFALLFLICQVGANAQQTTAPNTIYGVTTSNQLVQFQSNTPGTLTTTVAITGLQAGENILGIDFRPANGQLYALGSTGRLYIIDLQTGAATQIGTGTFSTALSGTDFGFDFNPTVDRIRVVSNTGQNLRLDPNTGGIAAVDPNLNPGTPSVTASAYTNNFAGATTTTLYDIDTNTDRLLIQNPANAGTLVDVGPLGVDATGVNGFDIASNNGTAFAALTVGGTTRLFTINLATGAATQVGTFATTVMLRGIAVAFGTGAVGTSVLDYDGDRRTDFAVFRTTNNTFFVLRNSTRTLIAQQFGLSSVDIQVPGDYDGDGRTDFAVFRTTNGTFFVLNSSNNTIRAQQFGLGTDEPVARDYDGDRRTDFAVARRENGRLTWFILNSSNNSFRAEQFGLDTDVTAPGDYDGDGRFDLAVFRGGPNQQGTFFVQQSSQGFRAVQFGFGSDLVVPGDYDGDGRYDFAVVRPGTVFNWFILTSGPNPTFRSVQFGSKPQLTAQGDYDGDGRTDIATFNPQNGSFNLLLSSNGTFQQVFFGRSDDYPVANFDTH